ncbi:hypothetical protein Tco_0099949 [Tanacetum coccineum]
MGKQPVVDLEEDNDDDDEMASRRSITRWNNNEKILLAEAGIEHSQDANIGKYQHEDVYWNLIMNDFNSRTTAPPRTKNMMTGKWTRMQGDCQRFNGIYKHLNRKSGESGADLVENAKTICGKLEGGLNSLPLLDLSVLNVRSLVITLRWSLSDLVVLDWGDCFLGVSGFGIGEVALSTLDVLQRFGFFLQMGFTLILATLDGLDVGLLGDFIDEDDCDDD